VHNLEKTYVKIRHHETGGKRNIRDELTCKKTSREQRIMEAFLQSTYVIIKMIKVKTS
jgi:hypothetical protein